MDSLWEKAKKTPQRIALPEAENEVIMQAAEQIVLTGIGTPVIIGSPEAVEASAKAAGVKTDGFEIFDYTDEAKCAEFASRYLAKIGDLSEKAVLRRLKDPLNASMLLCKLDDADCVAAGREFTTGDVIRSAMSILGLAPGNDTVSSLGIMNIPGFEGSEGSLLAMGDCAVNPFPDAEGLANIAVTSAETVNQLLGWEPRVAMLSFSTCGSAEHESIDVILQAIELARAKAPGLKIDGEFQLDTAIVPKSAKSKMKRESDVAGKANVIIVPNLHAGNIGIKLVQIFGNADAYGPVLQGFTKPVSDFSRSAPLSEVMGNIVMLVIRAAAAKAARAKAAQ